MPEWVPLLESHRLPAVPGVYVIRHAATGKEYVGQSKNVRTRAASHRAAVSTHYFGRALRQHGLAAFEICLLAAGAPADLGRLEQETIAARGSMVPGGYNLSAGGLGPTGMKWSDERKAAQSLRVKGKPLAPETIEKMRLAALANNPFKGRKHSAEARAKMGAAAVALHTGRTRSDETRARISASLMGREAPVLSPEGRARVTAAARLPNPKKAQPGTKNGMHGVRGAEHPYAKRVAVWLPESFVPHAVFDTATEAAAWAGVKVASISDWCAGRYRPKNGNLWSQV